MRMALSLVAAVALAGCSGDSFVFPPHIEEANKVCAVNGGVRYIKNAERARELESCGSKCARPTGFMLYEGEAHCNNGAMFKMEFTRPMERSK